MAADDAPVGLPQARRRLEALRRALQEEIASLVRQIDTEDGNVVSRLDRLSNAERIRSQIVALMREEASVVLTIAEVASQQAADRILEKHAPPSPDRDVAPGVAVSTRADATATVRRVVSGALDGLQGVFGKAADDIRVEIDKAITGVWPQTRLLEHVARKLDAPIYAARVAVETAVRGTTQALLIEQAERGAAGTGERIVYLYGGPEDGKIREFCDDHIGKAYSKQALARLDNGQGLPVDPFCGGYRCRHRLSPLTVEDAEAEGIEVVL